MTDKNQTFESVYAEQSRSIYAEQSRSIKQYYGKILKTNGDLKTNACCTTDAGPAHLKPVISQIHPEVLEKFYGCGSPIPAVLEGKTVLDLGCGAGRDTFILSKLVGPEGKVIGVDMTEEQLAVARNHLDYHRQSFGYSKNNVEFLHGYIEDLEGLGIQTNSIDVVVSNCVINLSPEKRRVFSEIFRVLKPGGELYFADVFSGQRLPAHLAKDPVLVGECLGGALYIEDFRRLLAEIGCLDSRVVTQRKIILQNPDIEHKVGTIPFYSMTIRAFKLKLEDRCEDYGQVAYYLGTIPQCSQAFPLDDHHLFEKGRPVLVCSNTAAMLAQTRYALHFRVEGDLSTHYGLFDCGPKGSIVSGEAPLNQGCC
ncbi:MAG: methyltransferase domain-containing protein [Deltaproteobacteria bacterium]|nr:methyltransferase domain-containing protein [Deltaproteobacteria bacterium]